MKGAKALGSSTQIVHVFMNLLVNSAHAVKAAARGDNALIKVSCTETDGQVQVAVRDNGVGVPTANIPKLLDPFFTTKAPGEGMGLGLSICHTIVKNHGGAIQITSEPGEWTEVRFDLPTLVPVRSAA
jgi:signal transduction histidine kinase